MLLMVIALLFLCLHDKQKRRDYPQGSEISWTPKVSNCLPGGTFAVYSIKYKLFVCVQQSGTIKVKW